MTARNPSCSVVVLLCFVLVAAAKAGRVQIFTKEDYDDAFDEEESSLESTSSHSVLALQEQVKNNGRVGHVNDTNPVQTFVIKVPMMSNDTDDERTIEIKIPMELMNLNHSFEMANQTQHSNMNISSLDDQRMKNIEAALMQVLLGEMKAVTESPKRKPTDHIATTSRTFTPNNSNPLAPITEMILAEIRRGQIPQILQNGIEFLQKRAQSYEVVIDTVECVLFFYCGPEFAFSNYYSK